MHTDPSDTHRPRGGAGHWIHSPQLSLWGSIQSVYTELQEFLPSLPLQVITQKQDMISLNHI